MKNKRKIILASKIISAITVGSIIFQPMTAMAGITKADPTKSGTITTNGNVTQIYADQIQDDVAFNVFSEFNLEKNNIANMYLNTNIGGVEANNLVNFVNSRIDINGTVNAVKNNTIGGNLYFLSKDGMAVGASGVINAGSLSAIIPTADYYNKLLNSDKNGVNLNNFNNYWKDIQKASAISVNDSGTITVNGKINTVDSITLKAGTIQTGTDSIFSSGITDFSSLVNIDGIADAGLKYLIVAQSGNGDITLGANTDININNTITSNNADSRISIYATRGAINQNEGTTITTTGNKIILSAFTGINNIDITSLSDDTLLSAISDTGDVDITVHAGDGKAGNISLDKTPLVNSVADTFYISTDSGNISLTTDGNITTNTEDFTAVKGNSISLTSKNGSIGTTDNVLSIDITDTAGSMSANAAKDINLVQGANDSHDPLPPLSLGSVHAGEDINITAQYGIFSIDDSHYISSDKGNITLKSHGDVGTIDKNVYIKNTSNDTQQVTISTWSGSDIYLKGLKFADNDAGSLFIKNVSANNVYIDTEGTLELKNGLNIGNNIDLRAQGDIVSDNNIYSTTGSVYIEAEKNLKTNGAITVNEAITLKSGEDTVLNNTVTSKKGSIVANSGKNFSSFGNISSGNNYLTIDAKQNLTTNGTLSAKNDITLNSGEDTQLNNTVTSNAGSITAKAGQAFTATSNITADSKVDITAGKDAALNGSITSNKDSISVNADNIAANNDITAGNIDLTANSQLNLNSGTVEADTATMQAGTNINQQDGHVIFANNLTAKAATGVNIANSTNNLQNVTVQNTGTGDVKVGNNGLNNIYVNVLGKDNNSFIDGAVDIHNYSNDDGNLTDLIVNSSIKSADNINISNDEANVQVKEDVTSTGGSITVNSNNDFTSDGNISANNDSVSIDAKQNLTTNGTVSAKNNISLISDNDTALNNTVTSTNGSITAKAVHDITAKQGISANGKVNITADNDIALNTVTSNSDTIIVNGNNISADDISANKDITINSQNDASLQKITSANGAISVDAKTISANDISADKDITVNSQNDASLQKITATNGAISVNAKTISANDISANKDITINSQNDASLQKVTATNGAISVDAKTISADDILAKNDITITGKDGNVTLNADTISTDGSVSLDAKQNLTANGAVSAKGDISLISGNDTALNNTVTSTNGSITAKAVHDITAKQGISANGKVNITSDNALALNTVTSKSDTILVESNNITTDDISADKDITVNSQNDASLQKITSTNGAISIDAKNISTDDISANKDITVNSQNDASLQKITSANGAISVNGKNIAADDILAKSDITITGKDGDVSLNAVTSNAGSITANAGQAFTANGNITADSKVGITAKEDTALNGSITSNNDSVSVNADNIAANNDITANNIDLTADNQLNLNSGTLKADTATMQAGTNINQQNGHGISVKTLTAQAATGINIANSTNHLQNVTVQNTGTGDVKVGSNGLYDVNVNVLGKDDTNFINGSVDIHNYNNNNGTLTDLTVNSSIKATNNISITNGEATTKLSKDITSTDGSITVNSNDFISDGDISAENASVSLNAQQNIITNGTVSAKGDISLASGGDTQLNNTVSSNTGSITANAGQAFTANDNITADSKVDISAGKDAVLNGSITSNNSSVSVNADNIAANNNITAIDNIDLTADSQLNLNSGTIKADTATMQAGTNINQQDGHVISVNNLTAQAATGVNIANSTNHLQNVTVQNTGTGDVNVGISGLHDVNIAILGKDDSNTINGSVDIHNYDNQDSKLTDLTVNTPFIATDGINIINNEAGIKLNEDITSGTNVNLNTNNGDIIFGGDVTAEQGSITITVDEKGNITGNNTLKAPDIKNGNVFLHNKGEGDINIWEIYAGNTADLTAKNGNITVDTVSGKLINVSVLNPDKTEDIAHMYFIKQPDNDLLRENAIDIMNYLLSGENNNSTISYYNRYNLYSLPEYDIKTDNEWIID